MEATSSCCIDQVETTDDDVFQDLSETDERNSCCEYKRRCRSVIDSLGAGDASILLSGDSTSHCQRRRTLSSDMEWPDQDYSTAAELPKCLGADCERMAHQQDALDALMQNVPTNDALAEDTHRLDFTAKMPCHIDADCYNMSHKERGKCVVFNQEIFEMGFDRREGSTADAERINKTFGNLGFTVIVHNNLSHTDVIARITELSQDDYTESDCICIFVLTHGLNNDMICARDVAYKSDNIWKPFTADKCKSLAGKPKLFFFQACRGEGLDGGVILKARHAMGKSSETDAPVASYKIPTHADFLIAHSSVQGFFSWRNPEEGTWYVKCLCDVLDEYADKMDLTKMLTITARKVATEYASLHDNPAKNDQKQVPSTVSMLIRDIYFTPK